MEAIVTYQIGNTEYEIYLAASGDYCVSVSRHGEDRKDYNLGTIQDALIFIMSQYEV